MFSEDDIDFTPSSKTNLASLFNLNKSASSNGNQSLTYKAPKQPKARTKYDAKTDSDSSSDFKRSKPHETFDPKPTEKQRTTKTLDLLAVKTIQAFKMENGSYNSVGKLKVALCGSFSNKYFELLVYRDKTSHACRATVTKNFKFIMQVKNYAAFYDKSNQLWSILFESVDDVLEFGTQIALVKWCCSADPSNNSDVLIQNLVVGPNDAMKAEDGSTLDIYYVAKTITSEFKLGREVANNENDGQPISITIGSGWEKGLVGATINCKRIIIIPPSLLGSWKPLVVDECPLLLIVTVIKIEQSSSPLKNNELEFLRTGCTDDGTDDSVNSKTVPRVCRPGIINRIAKMGHPILPTQDNIPFSNDSRSDSEEDVIPKKGAVGMKHKKRNFLNPAQVNQKKPHSPVLGIQENSISPSQSQQLDIYSHFVHSAPISAHTIPVDSHLSVYLSEMRMQNSEVRIGIGRVTDKVDQVLTKLEPKPSIDLNSLDTKIEKLTEINKEIKNKMFSDISTIESQYNEILSLLRKKADKPEIEDKLQVISPQTERTTGISQLETKLSELESKNSELNTMLTQALLENNRLKVAAESGNELCRPSLKETSDGESYRHNFKGEIKQKMNTVYQALKMMFHPEKHYSGREIHAILYDTIKSVTLECLQEKSTDIRSRSLEEKEAFNENKGQSLGNNSNADVPSINSMVFNEAEISRDSDVSIIPVDSK